MDEQMRPLTHAERARWSAHDPSVARLLARMRYHFPDLRVVFKDDSRVYQLLNKVIPDEVLYRMSTTLFCTIAMGSREKAGRDQRWYRRVLAHEFVHLFQFRHPLDLIFYYLAPQIWILLCGGIAWVLALLCVPSLSGVALALAGVGVLVAALLPWPSPWRLRCELQAYLMNIAVDHWTGRGFDADDISRRARLMSGRRYWKMAWSYQRTRDRYAEMSAHVRDDDELYLWDLSPAYYHVHSVLTSTGPVDRG